VSFIIGIDLGTTNCAMAAVDARVASDEPSPVTTVPIPQVVNPHEVDGRPLLPSFLFQPGELDFPAGSTDLPWGTGGGVVGELARRRGAENPARLVSSAKSWLSTSSVDRTAAILPWGAPDEVPKVSPVEASARYLGHLRDAWNHAHAGDRLEEQDVLLTVPASFDEEARTLTLRAAEAAGLRQVTLLEEPQAAFYAWLAHTGDDWRRRVKVGDLVLVCDVGGGTTDFSLIAVGERDGELSLERVAVGDHILLGGDNMDLALARLLQERLESEGHRIDTWQLQQLWHQARSAKETLFDRLLDEGRAATHPVTVLGRGRRVVGGTITTALSAGDLERTIVEGFFPQVDREARPARQRRVGFQELGLPYAADPAVTRHLASFLSRQGAASASHPPLRRGPSGLACPTHVLFNGGVFKSRVLRDQLVAVLNTWLAAEGFTPLDATHVLDAPDLDHAVARGAAYYGQARHGRGVRIRSGAPRSYYVGIESAMPAVPDMPAPLKALCVVPFGMEEGTSAAIAGREFGLVVGESAEFRFLSSLVRKTDTPGTLVQDWGDDLEELSPLEVTLRIEGQEDTVVPVTLESRVTEVGTLELWCVAREGSRRWKLELDIRTGAA